MNKSLSLLNAFFFFSSRRRHTRLQGDWSSDVCSSDLPDDDAVLYDPATKRIFTFNGDAHSATAIDAVSGKRLGDIELGAGPEFGGFAGDGKLFVNLGDKNAVAGLDAAAMRVKRQGATPPCESPTGLAHDRVHHL